jgi:hypothetical protein
VLSLLTVLPFATVAGRIGGAAIFVVAVLLVRYAATAGHGVAGAIINPPDLITDRRPPRQDVERSVGFYGRVIRVVLVVWGSFLGLFGLFLLIRGR